MREDRYLLVQAPDRRGPPATVGPDLAESTLAQRKLQLLQAEPDIERTSDQLRRILHLPREDWARPILPTEPP